MRGASEQPLDYHAVWSAARTVLERLAAAWEKGATIDECLDLIVELVHADRGLLILALPGGADVVVNARGEGRALSAVEREEIGQTLVREARQSGRVAVCHPLRGEGGSESMVSLGIVTAIAVPLGSRNEATSSGVLYVDFRRVDAAVGPLHIEFLESLGALLGALAAQQSRLAATREHLRHAQTRSLEAAPAAALEELLMPTSMAGVRSEIASCLDGDSSIFILGESGTGKTLLAQAIATASRRRPVVRAMLGASDDLNTVTSELFGHERGAYSGAITRRIGLVELANKGTLVLDEVLNLSRNTQKLLLDFTQFRTYRPLGWESAEPKRADVRIVAATNGDLDAAMRQGLFREDLFHRLSTVTLHLPPLRDRREDIPALAESYLRRLDPESPWALSGKARRRLVAEDLAWSGNVRQLERVVHRARDRAQVRDPQSFVIDIDHLDARDLGGSASASSPPPPGRSTPPGGTLTERWNALQQERELLDTTERDVLAKLLAEHGFVVSKVARALNLPRSTLVSRLEAIGIEARRSASSQGSSTTE